MGACFEDLDQPIEYEEYPGVGHVSWHNTYKDGRIFDWFTQHGRDPHPREVNLLTTDPARYGTSYWIQVEGLNKPRVPGRISARVTTGNLITVETRNITCFILNTAAWQAAEKPALHPTIDIHFPVKADTAITDQDTDRADLILVGTPATHSLIARIEAQLPIRIDPDGIHEGEQIFGEQDPLILMIHPNPLNRRRYVQISGGTSATAFSGLLRLPPGICQMFAGIPDYAILRPDATTVTEGLFDMDWHLPPRNEDGRARVTDIEGS